MPVRKRCVKTWIYRGDKRIKILYCLAHHVFIFFHSAPFYFRCIFSFSNSMHMDTASVLPFESVPPIFQTPLLFQDIIKENLKSLVEKPDCNMRIINNALMVASSCSFSFCMISTRWHEIMELGPMQVSSTKCKEYQAL